jgi:hypothetical protein
MLYLFSLLSFITSKDGLKKKAAQPGKTAAAKEGEIAVINQILACVHRK